jgi:hypothetical protein
VSAVDLSVLPLDELLNAMQRTDMTLSYPGEPGFIELRRRFDSLTRERDEAREQVRLHVECMCGHLADDHDGECQGFNVHGGSHGGAVDVECDCENFRPAWAEWWQRAETAERERDGERLDHDKTKQLLNEWRDASIAAERERDEAREERDAEARTMRAITDALLAAEAEVVRLREALRPFAGFAQSNVEAAVEEEGRGRWTDGKTGCQHERIVDWFGPSDFFIARAALGGAPDGE